MRQPKWFRFLWGWIGLTWIGLAAAQADEWLPPGPIGEIFVRQIPALSVIEAEVHGHVETSWEKGFRQNARYVAAAEIPLHFPIMIVLTDWAEDKITPDGRYLVQLALDDRPSYGAPRENGLSVVTQSPTVMACYTWRGGYTFENYQRALQRVLAHLRAKDIPVAGPPRVLLYSNVDWTPNWWRVGELQVPIPDQAKPN